MNAKTILALGFLIIAISLAYYFVVFLPGNYKSDRELEKQKWNAELQFKSAQAKNKEDHLESCLKSAHENYMKTWNINCPKLGKINKEDGSCSLPAYLSDSIEKDYKEDQELCIKRFK